MRDFLALILDSVCLFLWPEDENARRSGPRRRRDFLKLAIALFILAMGLWLSFCR
jgi:hypothetical protein